VFIECHRRIQALRAHGEDVSGYGRVIAPKILLAFPDDLCLRWFVHAKREGHSEVDVLSLMKFLVEEVDGTLTMHKIGGEGTRQHNNTPNGATFHYSQKLGARPDGLPESRHLLRVLRDSWPLGTGLRNGGGYRRKN